MSHTCCACGSYGPFSSNQKRKGASRRCYDCSSGGGYDSYAVCHTGSNPRLANPRQICYSCV